MFDTVLGIPVHPLVVHAVVVLGPLTAVLLVLFALSGRLRARIGIALPVLATVVAAGAVLAEESGEALERRIGGGSELVEAHAELGERLPPALAATAALCWVLWLLWRRSVRGPGGGTAGNGPSGGGTAGGSRSGGGVALRLVTLVGLVAAVGVTVLVVLVGHSGAQAVWQGVGSQTVTGGDGG